jgi:hypothetical protein
VNIRSDDLENRHAPTPPSSVGEWVEEHWVAVESARRSWETRKEALTSSISLPTTPSAYLHGCHLTQKCGNQLNSAGTWRR